MHGDSPLGGIQNITGRPKDSSAMHAAFRGILANSESSTPAHLKLLLLQAAHYHLGAAAQHSVVLHAQCSRLLVDQAPAQVHDCFSALGVR
jgi:hypothetical protein